jgi:hypothetical protein
MLYRVVVLIFAMLLYFPGIGSADYLGMDKGRIVAQNWLTHCINAYGSWAGVSSPTISGEETLMHQNEVVGFNFLIYPKGNILVTARDDLPPVKLYSDTSTLSIYAENTGEIAAWIAGEISQTGKAIDAHASDPTVKTTLLQQNNPDVKAWKIFSDAAQFDREYRRSTAGTESLSIGPLLTSTWDQGDPYNRQCPKDSKECRTIVGCVATAVSQIMKYWSHPKIGAGIISYQWYDGSVPVTLGRDFSSSTYDWANMPNSLDSTNTDVQKDAVAKLCTDVGIASQMEYGCTLSTANISADVFKTYFRYMNTATWVKRSDYSSLSAWMQVFKNEVQNGRPSELGVTDPKNNAGHAVVVDGYRDTPLETVHINMGWGGSYDAWYVPDSFTTGQDNWTVLPDDGAVIGIQPDKSPAPIIKANGLHGTVTVPSAQPVSIDITLDAAGDSGKLADWWTILSSPWGYYSWVYPTGWAPGIIAIGQFPLTNIPSFNIYNGIMPIGDYTFYFGVDETPDGILNQPLYYNAVNVQVRKEVTLEETSAINH